MKNRQRAYLVVFLFVWTIGLMGCAQASHQTNLPFAISMSNDAAFVQLSAQKPGFMPGEEAVFDLTIQNRGNELWQDRYCVVLLNNDHSSVDLRQDEFILKADEQYSQELKIQLPEDLTAGVYGLALVIPNSFSMISNLSIGDSDDITRGSWLEPTCQ